jgi:hypothetical protein
MRLVTVESTANTWAWLEAETHAEAQALNACAAQGEWTNGRGSDAWPGSALWPTGWDIPCAIHTIQSRQGRTWWSCGEARVTCSRA